MTRQTSTRSKNRFRARAGLFAAALTLTLASCSGDGPSWFNFPSSKEDRVGSGPVREGTSGVWLKEGVDQQQRDADIRQCREVAAAQVARDRQVDQDRSVGQQTLGSGGGGVDLTRSLDDYSREQRQARLFARCMRSKGYEQR